MAREKAADKRGEVKAADALLTDSAYPSYTLPGSTLLLSRTVEPEAGEAEPAGAARLKQKRKNPFPKIMAAMHRSSLQKQLRALQILMRAREGGLDHDGDMSGKRFRDYWFYPRPDGSWVLGPGTRRTLMYVLPAAVAFLTIQYATNPGVGDLDGFTGKCQQYLDFDTIFGKSGDARDQANAQLLAVSGMLAQSCRVLPDVLRIAHSLARSGSDITEIVLAVMATLNIDPEQYSNPSTNYLVVLPWIVGGLIVASHFLEESLSKGVRRLHHQGAVGDSFLARLDRSPLRRIWRGYAGENGLQFIRNALVAALVMAPTATVKHVARSVVADLQNIATLFLPFSNSPAFRAAALESASCPNLQWTDSSYGCPVEWLDDSNRQLAEIVDQFKDHLISDTNGAMWVAFWLSVLALLGVLVYSCVLKMRQINADLGLDSAGRPLMEDNDNSDAADDFVAVDITEADDADQDALFTRFDEIRRAHDVAMADQNAQQKRLADLDGKSSVFNGKIEELEASRSPLDKLLKTTESSKAEADKALSEAQTEFEEALAQLGKTVPDVQVQSIDITPLRHALEQKYSAEQEMQVVGVQKEAIENARREIEKLKDDLLAVINRKSDAKLSECQYRVEIPNGLAKALSAAGVTDETIQALSQILNLKLFTLPRKESVKGNELAFKHLLEAFQHIADPRIGSGVASSTMKAGKKGVVYALSADQQSWDLSDPLFLKVVKQQAQELLEKVMPVLAGQEKLLAELEAQQLAFSAKFDAACKALTEVEGRFASDTSKPLVVPSEPDLEPLKAAYQRLLECKSNVATTSEAIVRINGLLESIAEKQALYQELLAGIKAEKQACNEGLGKLQASIDQYSAELAAIQAELPSGGKKPATVSASAVGLFHRRGQSSARFVAEEIDCSTPGARGEAVRDLHDHIAAVDGAMGVASAVKCAIL